jgi:surface antigen
MRLAALVVGITIAGTIVSANSATVSAQTTSDEQTEKVAQTETNIVALLTSDSESLINLADWIIGQEETEKEEDRQPTKYKIQDGDTLTSIAEQHSTQWERLWQKNTSLQHPDELVVGDELVVPFDDEKLAHRDLPKPPVEKKPGAKRERKSDAVATKPAKRQRAAASRSISYGSTAGNTYTPGYCTWYAKNKRPDLPNNLGNADTWVSRARAQGIPTGSAPRVGAIGQRGMHVVYVERVNSDGTVYISEMNRRGLYVVSTRTVPASDFMYIY